jgi:hypothetical protein
MSKKIGDAGIGKDDKNIENETQRDKRKKEITQYDCS